MEDKRKIRFSENLKKLYEEQGDSIVKIANELGLNKSTLHSYIHGASPRGLVAAQRLSAYFGISIDSLIFGDEETIFPNNINLSLSSISKFEVTIKPLLKHRRLKSDNEIL